MARFVCETKQHGDPVHLSRALAMQAEMFNRLADFRAALESVSEIFTVYDASKHSAAVCHAYGSDRVAQAISLSSLWHEELGNSSESRQVAEFVIDDLLPKMDRKNVHNSLCLLFPILWVLKEDGRALQAREVFYSSVVQPFFEFFGEKGTTPCLVMFEPILKHLDLCVGVDPKCTRFHECLTWALHRDNLRFDAVANAYAGVTGRLMDAVSAETCYFLARGCGDTSVGRALVQSGMEVARTASVLATKNKFVIAKIHVERVISLLDAVASDLGLIEGSKSQCL